MFNSSIIWFDKALYSFIEITESNEPSANPTSAVEPDGTVHVAWQDWTDYEGSGEDYDIFYKYRIEEENIPLIPILVFEDIKGGLAGISVVLKIKHGSKILLNYFRV